MDDATTETCTRRSFLCTTLQGVAACTTGVIALGSIGCASVGHVNGELVDQRRLSIDASAFQNNPDLLVYHPRLEHPVYVRRRETDGGDVAYSAVLTTCTHRGCQVEPTGSRMICPCHGSEFHHDGTLVRGPADRPLVSFPVEHVDSTLFIELRKIPV